MKKLMTLALAAAFAATLAACTDTDHGNITLPTPTEAATTENVEATSTETAEPVTTETSESTAEVVNPTEETKYAVLDFNECAEEVLRLKPVHNNDNKLPDDADGETVLYYEGDLNDEGLSWFASDGERIYTVDRDANMQVYDSNGFLKRMQFDDKNITLKSYISDGKIYNLFRVFNTEDGSCEAKLKPAENMKESYSSISIIGNNGTPCFAEVDYETEQSGIGNFYIYSLDADNSWQKGEKLFTLTFNDDDTIVKFANGNSLNIPGNGSLVGIDGQGYYFFGSQRSVIKVSPDGNITASVTIPVSSDDLWYPAVDFNILPDGTVYVAAAMNDAYVIWKIAM